MKIFFFSANTLHSEVKVASLGDRRKREQNAEALRGHRERKRQAQAEQERLQMPKETLLNLLERQTMTCLTYRGNFGQALSPRRVDYLEKSKEEIIDQIIHVESCLRNRLNELIQAKGQNPSHGGLDQLEKQLRSLS